MSLDGLKGSLPGLVLAATAVRLCISPNIDTVGGLLVASILWLGMSGIALANVIIQGKAETLDANAEARFEALTKQVESLKAAVGMRQLGR